MIVENMPISSIRAEFKYGSECAGRKAESAARKARKGLGRAPGRIFILNYTDPRKNLWHVLVIAGRTGFQFMPFLEYNDSNGYYRIILHSHKSDTLQIFTGHFFSRVRERIGLGDSGTNVTIEIFRFLHVNNVNQPVLRQDNVVQIEFQEGVGLGYSYGQGVYIIKTFITHDMLRGEQAVLSQKIRAEMEA